MHEQVAQAGVDARFAHAADLPSNVLGAAPACVVLEGLLMDHRQAWSFVARSLC